MTREAAVAAVARTWNGRAADYDRCYRAYPETGRDAWRTLYREAIHTLLGPAGRPLRVLDVGTGTGFAAVLLAELGHDVTGMDASARMLDLARAEAARRGVTVRWRHGDGHDPDSADYDLVTCRYVLWTLPAPAAALLRSAGFGPPRQFGQLLPSRTRRDSRDFFVAGATRQGRT